MTLIFIYQYEIFFLPFLPFVPLIIGFIAMGIFFPRDSLREKMFNIILLGVFLGFMGLAEFGVQALYIRLGIHKDLCLITGCILLFVGGSFILIPALYRAWLIYKVQEKENYLDVEWLKHQYHDLGRSIQEIADDQNVSMMKIREALEKGNILDK